MPDDRRLDLVLYVAPQSAASVRARRNLEALLLEYDGNRLQLVVRDVAEEPFLAEEDQVVFTPTLIVRTEGGAARVVGDLVDGSAVVNALTMGGLEKKE